MADKHAKVLDDKTFTSVLAKVAQGPDALRDQAMLLLSYKAGLRAQEIAGIRWTDVTDALGNVRDDHLFVPSSIAKNEREATLPMHPHLYIVLTQLRAARPGDHYVVYPSRRGAAGSDCMTANAVALWFRKLYEGSGLEGCSSHSGRRTFITKLARTAGKFDCSIKDVQRLARHAHLGTTEGYIDPSPTIGRLVSAI